MTRHVGICNLPQCLVLITPAQQTKVSTLCAEKTEWLEEHLDCSLEEVTWQKRDFESRLQPFTNKLAN